MTGLAALVVSVALVDSLNPGTIVPALYLATGPRPVRAVLGFALGYFVVNMLGGIAVVLVGHEIFRRIPHPGRADLHLAEIVFGVVAIVAAAVMWRHRGKVEPAMANVETRVTGVASVAGATIAAVELPTAVPYFAVIAALIRSDQNTAALVGLVVIFNLLFLAPVFAIALLRALAGERTIGLLTRARQYVLRYAGVVGALVVLALGIALVALGVVGIHSG